MNVKCKSYSPSGAVFVIVSPFERIFEIPQNSHPGVTNSPFSRRPAKRLTIKQQVLLI
jgi:hypothetical protein